MFAFQFFVGDPLTRTTVRGGIGVGNGYFFLGRRLKGTSAPFFSLRLLIEGLDRAGIDGPISRRIRGGRRVGGRLLRRCCSGRGRGATCRLGSRRRSGRVDLGADTCLPRL